MTPAQRLTVKPFILLTSATLVLVTLLCLGISYQSRQMNQSIEDLSGLSDPSPFRAALLGYLGKIHLGLEGYLQNADPALMDQVVQSRADFEASLPQFSRQSPRLFPTQAMEEISRGFGTLKESMDQLLQSDTRRVEHRRQLDQNFSQILTAIDREIRPLIRRGQPDDEERKEAILQVENQARAWQQNLLKSWAQPSPKAADLTYENDNRGKTHLERYSRLELIPRERKALKQLQATWEANSDIARESFVMEKLVREGKTFLDAQHAQVVGALNKYLPALPPAEMEQRKESHARAIWLHLALACVCGLLLLATLIAAVLGAFRIKRGQPLLPPRAKKIMKVVYRDSTLQMDLKGAIAVWSPAAEALYGYTAAEMQGQPISRLFESESDIGHLYKELVKSPQTTFETTHKAKSGLFFRIRMEFFPILSDSGQTAGIGLICTRK